jgi:hypothetical protein
VVVEHAKRGVGGVGSDGIDGTYALTGETGSLRYMPPEAISFSPFRLLFGVSASVWHPLAIYTLRAHRCGIPLLLLF